MEPNNSESDDDLPEIGSLRARLARKRKFQLETSRSVTVSAEPRCISGSLQPAGNNTREVPGQTRQGTSVSQHEISDSSGDELQQGQSFTLPAAPCNTTEHQNASIGQPTKSVSSLSSRIPNNCGKDKIPRVPLHDLSDSSDDEIERQPLSQMIGSLTSPCSKGLTDTSSGPMGRGSKQCPGREGSEKLRKKRTTEEIEENKRKAQERKEDRERKKLAKEAEKQMKKIERESKKETSLGSCLKYIKVLIDTNVVNMSGMGAALLKTCEELGVSWSTEALTIPNTVMWRRLHTECSMTSSMEVQTIQHEREETDVLCLLSTADFVEMVHNFKQKQVGRSMVQGSSLRDYIQTLKPCLPGKSITVVVPGIEQYFRDLKSRTQKNYREAVLAAGGDPAPKGKQQKSKGSTWTTKVSRVDIEEAVTDCQLQTSCCTYMLESPDDVADLVKRFTKAVAEKPAKKDRFDAIFSFYEEGGGGVKVDKAGHGLLKVWKQQLLQFKNVSPDVAEALIQAYPSPQLLIQAYRECVSEKEAIGLLENIVVRRGAGVLETTRRVGKEMARRIHTFFSSSDPHLLIK